MSKRKQPSSSGEAQEPKRQKSDGKASKKQENSANSKEAELPDDTKLAEVKQLDYKSMPQFQGYILSVSTNRNKSDVWNVFAKNKPASLVKCTYCEHEYSITSKSSIESCKS